jgi:hypothetical protein
VRAGERYYPLPALRYVWHRRTGRLRHGGYMLVTRGGAVLVLIGLLVAAGFAARRVDISPDRRTMAIAGGILAVVVLGGIAAFSVEFLLDLVDRTHDHGKGRHELWVRSGEGDEMIYSTTDATKFGQVYRALQRAIERGG